MVVTYTQISHLYYNSILALHPKITLRGLETNKRLSYPYIQHSVNVAKWPLPFGVRVSRTFSVVFLFLISVCNNRWHTNSLLTINYGTVRSCFSSL